jgi:two-component system chemotaxis response regulator CheB
MVKVLIVDDSALMRKHIAILLGDAGCEVLTARNGLEAVEQVVSLQPDVITLDINMPEMDGLTALSLIMAARPTPVVMVSSLTRKGALSTLEALAMGAVDFIEKPGGTISLNINNIAGDLVDKVLRAATARPRQAARILPARLARPSRPPAIAPSTAESNFGLVVVGVSTGGPRTLEDILPSLPATLPWPVVIAQHMPASFTGPLAGRLDSYCHLSVQEVGSVTSLVPGNIYIAKGGTDMVIGRRGGKLVAVSKPEASKYLWHPSVDALMGSALEHLPASMLIGVQLTGMGNDGATAMTECKRRGGRTIAESESTAVVFGMPKELIQSGGATCVLPSNKVSAQIVAWLR